jgi:hypothetical protein
MPAKKRVVGCGPERGSRYRRQDAHSLSSRQGSRRTPRQLKAMLVPYPVGEDDLLARQHAGRQRREQ